MLGEEVARNRLSQCLGATFSDDKRLLHGRSFSGPVPCTVVWLATRRSHVLVDGTTCVQYVNRVSRPLSSKRRGSKSIRQIR
jgi:hypothetical protein